MAHESAVVAILAAQGTDERAVEALKGALRGMKAHSHVLGIHLGSSSVLPDGWVEDVSPGYYDALIIPPGNEGIRALAARPAVAVFLRRMIERRAPIAVLGDGAELLRACGIFDANRVTSPEPAPMQCGIVVGRAPDAYDLAAARLLAEVYARKRFDVIDEQSEESFPASDAPGRGAPLAAAHD